MICRHCDSDDCHKHCQENTQGHHVVDLETVAGQEHCTDSSLIQARAKCRLCGKTGCVDLHPTDLWWE